MTVRPLLNRSCFQPEGGVDRSNELDSGYLCIYAYGMTRFVMNISDELHRRLKIVCTLQGKTMTQIAQQLLQEYVEKEEKRKLILYPRR